MSFDFKIDVIIPSYKSIDQYSYLKTLCETRTVKGKVIFTGQKCSASKNRNIGLSRCINEYVIMIDDDIEGFYNGWDYDLIKPLIDDQKIKLVSSRLINKDGSFGEMMSNNFDVSTDIVQPNNNLVPSSAIAFRRNIGICFDEIYVGSGYEDTDFCYQIIHNDPLSKIVINNKCRLIHISEKKNQVNNLSINSQLFLNKWKKLP